VQIATSSSQVSTGDKKDVSVFPTGQMLPFVLVTVLFFLWGMSNNLTDILVQQFRKGFSLSQLQAQMVQFAVFTGYFCMALPAAFLMRRWGYKAGILTGLCIFGIGMLLFWPAAMLGKYAPFLIALFVVGCGSATLETAANPFIAQFGPPETTERRLNFAQAFNPPGTIVGVLIGTLFIFSGVELSASRVARMKVAGTYAAYLHTEIMRVVPTYVALGCVVLLWAVVLGRTRFPVIESEQSGEKGSFRALMHFPHLWFAVVAQFCYCGAQITTWSAFIPYIKQYTTMTEKHAGYFLMGNLILIFLGRFISTWLMRWFRPAKMIGVYGIVNMVLLVGSVSHPGLTGAIAIMVTSFFMSLMFPTIFALGVKGLGVHTKLGGSLLVMSVVGGAVIPLILGAIARSTGSLARGYIVVIAAYLIVVIYGFAEGRDVSLESVDRAPEIM
jgi:FHS family L-fucose permease-like MFS transporter